MIPLDQIPAQSAADFVDEHEPVMNAAFALYAALQATGAERWRHTSVVMCALLRHPDITAEQRLRLVETVNRVSHDALM